MTQKYIMRGSGASNSRDLKLLSWLQRSMFVHLTKDDSGAVLSTAVLLSPLTYQQSSQPSKKPVLPINASSTSLLDFSFYCLLWCARNLQPLDSRYVNSVRQTPFFWSELPLWKVCRRCCSDISHSLQLTAETRNLTPEETLTKAHLFIQQGCFPLTAATRLANRDPFL